MHNEGRAAGIEQVSHDQVEAILKLASTGLSPEGISLALQIDTEVVQHVIADHPGHGSGVVHQMEAKAPQQHEDTFPTFIYSYEGDTDQLHRTNLVTGEQTIHQVPSFRFKNSCCWNELPGGSLLITGGGVWIAEREVVKIDTRREFQISSCSPMLTPRAKHAAVYHAQHVYVLGGYDDGGLSDCERYVCEDDRWEALPPLPRACHNLSGAEVEGSLYALGGWFYGSSLDLVQKLTLESLTWELMELRLPFAYSDLPCFKVRGTEVYLVVKTTLCSFTGLEIRPLKTLTEDIHCKFGASYYYKGTLYCSNYEGAVRRQEIGSLSN
jgi:hypothetical protein